MASLRSVVKNIETTLLFFLMALTTFCFLSELLSYRKPYTPQHFARIDTIVGRIKAAAHYQEDVDYIVVPNGYGHSDFYLAESDQYPHSCFIKLSVEMVNEANDDAIAWVVGHELGHCAMFHQDEKMKTNTKDFTYEQRFDWEQEYDADQYGYVMANRAGYDAAYGFVSFATSWPDDRDGLTHPSMPRRLAAVNGGTRTYTSDFTIQRPYAILPPKE